MDSLPAHWQVAGALCCVLSWLSPDSISVDLVGLPPVPVNNSVATGKSSLGLCLLLCKLDLTPSLSCC